MNTFDRMFSQGKIIKDYIDGKNKKSVKGKKTKANTALSFRIIELDRDIRTTIRIMSTCREIIDAYGTARGLDTYYRINNIWRIIKSLRNTRDFFFVLAQAINTYSISDQALLNAIKNSIKKTNDRMIRLKKTFLPEYFELCGLKNYIAWLDQNNTTIEADINRFYVNFKENNLDSFEEIQRNPESGETLNNWYQEMSDSYYTNVIFKMIDNNIPLEDPTQIILQENERIKKRKSEQKKKEEEEKRASKIFMAKSLIDHTYGIIYNAFRFGNTYSGKFYISHQTLSEMSSHINLNAKDDEKSFYMVLAVKLNGQCKAVRFGTKDKDGNPSLGKYPWKFNSAFYTVDEDEANAFAKVLDDENIYIDVCCFKMADFQTSYSQDEFGNLTEKVYGIISSKDRYTKIAQEVGDQAKIYVEAAIRRNGKDMREFEKVVNHRALINTEKNELFACVNENRISRRQKYLKNPLRNFLAKSDDNTLYLILITACANNDETIKFWFLSPIVNKNPNIIIPYCDENLRKQYEVEWDAYKKKIKDLIIVRRERDIIISTYGKAQFFTKEQIEELTPLLEKRKNMDYDVMDYRTRFIAYHFIEVRVDCLT